MNIGIIGVGAIGGPLARDLLCATLERIVAITTAIAAAYETVLAAAPEQWWGAFHPIWPDLVVGAQADEAEPAAS